jgi:hypothetical protein
MSLSDTAEYWWDVKSNYPYTGTEFYCIEGVECGYRHHNYSKYLREINCKGCKKVLEEKGNVFGLKEGITPSEQSKIDREKNMYKHGKCDCGSPLTVRTNKKTGQEFKGCTSYPKCKKTYSV